MFAKKDIQINDKLRFVNMSDIDVRKWNNCIINSTNELVYAYSWYLDVVNYEWEALIYGDYDIVMPLTNSKKYGILTLSQPSFTYQLGIFSCKKMNADLVKLFIDNIPVKYRYVNINLNKQNSVEELQKVKIEPQFTSELDLIEHYESILKNYSPKHKINLYKAFNNNLSVIYDIKPNELLKLTNIIVKQTKIRHEHINILRQLIAASIRYKSGYLYGVYDVNNNLISASLFIRGKYKICLVLSVSTEEGIKQNANLLLIDRVIKDFSGKNIVLDFNSNDIFYKGFGASRFTYNNIKINRLPFPVNMF